MSEEFDVEEAIAETDSGPASPDESTEIELDVDSDAGVRASASPKKRNPIIELWQTRRGLVLGMIAAIVVAIVAIVGLLMVFSSGSSTEEEASTAQMREGVPVTEAIAEAGGSCENAGAVDRRNCMLEGVSFQLEPGTWVRQAGERERQCNLGQASPATKVLTNTSWVIYADDEKELQKLQTALKGKGAPSQVLGYCEWNE